MEDLKKYSTSIVLEKEDSRYQFLIASQNYGTLYGIYGQINFKDDDTDTKIKNIDFELINYKGLFNIGFLADKGPYNEIKSYLDKKTKTLVLEIPVCGLSSIHTTSAEIKDLNNNNAAISVNNIKWIKVDRMLHKLVPGNANSEKVFDNEFYYKDGKDHANRTLRKGQKGFKDTGGTFKIFLASRNCHTSILKVFKP